MNGTGRLGHRFDSGVVRGLSIGGEVALQRSGFRFGNNPNYAECKSLPE